jgi:SRSO17 transposase
MTDQDIARLGPAFASFLHHFRPCFLQRRTAAHFDSYCRGLLSDLPRKSVEPIALACGAAVRTVQEFLTTAAWDQDQARDRLQRRLADHLDSLPTDPLGTLCVIDETNCLKQGAHTPGVQRQYLGCAGKVAHGIVTVHVGVTRGRFRALLDAEVTCLVRGTRTARAARRPASPAACATRPSGASPWSNCSGCTPTACIATG